MRRFADLLNEEYEARAKLAPGVLTEQMADLARTARSAGAVAAKICGAGGGGCLLLLAGPDREGSVRRALEAAGGRILDFSFDFTGLQCWSMDD
jgi:D-glycero-alpha-D-manno-heptose-7-phosphate kinase